MLPLSHSDTETTQITLKLKYRVTKVDLCQSHDEPALRQAAYPHLVLNAHGLGKNDNKRTNTRNSSICPPVLLFTAVEFGVV